MVKARRGTAPCMKVGGQLSLLLPPVPAPLAALA